MATIVGWIALLAALGAVAYAWKLSTELDTLRRRLDRYNRALFDANDEIRTLRETVAETTASLRVELMRRTATPAFTPEMTIRQAYKLHPQAEEVLAAFHLGGCSSCAVEQDETLAHACAQYGVDVEGMLANLNLLLSSSAVESDVAWPAGNGRTSGFTPVPVKLPNVEIDF